MGFASNTAHLLAEMERIDTLIRYEVVRARRLHSTDEQFRGLYISEEELDRLLAQPIGVPRWVSVDDRVGREKLNQYLSAGHSGIDSDITESVSQGIELRLPRLAKLFHLEQFDIDCLLIALAPEMDLRYERLFAYLQDDVTKKRPSVDLILSLLVASLEEKLMRRRHFSAEAPLLRYRLAELFEEPSHQPHPPLLARCVKLDDRIVQYLFGSDELDIRIRDFTDALAPDVVLERLFLKHDIRAKLATFLRQLPEKQAILYLQGRYGTGKRSIARAACRELGLGLLVVDLEPLVAAGQEVFGTTLSLLRRESTLRGAALFFKGIEAIQTNAKGPMHETFMRCLEQLNGLVFISGESPWEPMDRARESVFLRLELGVPSFHDRVKIWDSVLDGAAQLVDIRPLATKFVFTGGQIHDAANTARNLAGSRHGDRNSIETSDLYNACRVHSNQKLSLLAHKIVPKYKWHDIVLPDDRLEQLREICNCVKYRDLVYTDWGFDRKLSRGKGLAVLFAGPSGTGKTMAAEIIAAELSLDFYKIDLATVVSKYIGETEKNLSHIFAEAETSNAILFFDEADALFGKRSEVKDAHDRYANIEIGYLLQRMEEYEGVVILATNFRKNMDEAFVRRLHFAVEFPFPTEKERRRIWETIWPELTPKDVDLDLDFFARRFEIAGGNIRNIAVAATFIAANDGQRVTMPHLLRATQREYQKMGKIMAGEHFVSTVR